MEPATRTRTRFSGTTLLEHAPPQAPAVGTNKMICKNCQTEIAPGHESNPGIHSAPSHFNPYECIVALHEQLYAAREESAKLRAQLDAARGGWRPVTEAPLNVPVYVYVGYSDPFVARLIGENLWQDSDGAEFRFTDRERFLYHPLPPAPGDEEAQP